jgi:hypothetical protein
MPPGRWCLPPTAAQVRGLPRWRRRPLWELRRFAPGLRTRVFGPGTVGVEEMTLENADARYVITSAGGGVKQVELKGHLDAVTWRDRRAGKPVGPAVMNRGRPTPVMALLGVEAPGADPEYRLSRSNDVVVATRDLGNSLRLVKEFRIQSNHVVHVTTRLQNWGARSRVGSGAGVGVRHGGAAASRRRT